MDSILFASILSFLVAFFSIPLVIRVSDLKQIFDYPGIRKVHFVPIPSLGGIGIYFAISFSVLTMADFSISPAIQYFAAASLIVFFLGMKDDILRLSPFKKFVGQLLAAFILNYQGHYQLDSFHGFLGINGLSPLASQVFTYLTILVVINAYNLIDGVDGLAGMLGLIATLFFGVVFAIEHDVAHAIVAFSSAAGILAFLMYNFSPARIFLGDTGSLLIGLINAVLVIRFINIETSPNSILSFYAAPAVGLAVLFVPLFDTLRVSVIRIFKGRSPFDPDINHIHHVLLKRGLSHMQVTAILSATSLLLLVFSIAAQPLGINIVIFSLFIFGSVAATFLVFSSGANKYALEDYSTKGNKVPNNTLSELEQ